MAERTWKDIETGFIVAIPGGARAYKTGDWRSQSPKYNQERCIKCGICYIFCPDAAVRIRADGYVDFDEFYCKGCGICARECPVGAIEMVPVGKKD